jgi:drug/metabolite transporter (DMT)-like permease
MSTLRRIFRRGPWENAASLLIIAGVVMLMQPVSIALYGWSFTAMLTGVVLFTLVSKFPD